MQGHAAGRSGIRTKGPGACSYGVARLFWNKPLTGVSIRAAVLRWEYQGYHSHAGQAITALALHTGTWMPRRHAADRNAGDKSPELYFFRVNRPATSPSSADRVQRFDYCMAIFSGAGRESIGERKTH